MTKNKTSKKMTQVALASTLGVALLVGGGTYALWSASSTADTAAVISTGDLQVTAGATQSWYDVTDEANPAVVDLDTFRMVPGDKLKVAQDLNAVVIGDNISGILTVQVPNTTTSASILEQAKFAVDVFDAGDNLIGSVAPTVNNEGSLTVLVQDLPQTDAMGDNYRVEVTVELPSAADDATKLQTITLGDMAIHLDQGPKL